MKDKSVVLSISILISGRKEMRQCLESLSPFLKKLSCELILVDTGCNEEQLAIAREYTDIIVPFTWCKDFSAARNAGLKRARGEWFLYLDDDEWFEDPTEIVDFFLTGEYREYECARYYQRNYTSRLGEKKPYVDNVVLRMVKLTPETRFHGIIHEFLTPTCLPIKDFGTWVEHYGYIFENDADQYRHVERNASLLWKQLELEPDSLRWYTQLIQEYMGIKEYERVLELCGRAFAVYDRLKAVDNTQMRSAGAIYGYAATACLQKYDYEGAVQWAQRGIEDKLIYDCAKAHLYLVQTAACRKEEKDRECLKAFLNYIKIYREKGQDKYAIGNETSLINNTVFQEIPLIRTTLRGLISAARVHDKGVLEEYFYTLDWTDKRLFGQEDLEKALLEYACEEPGASLTRMIKTMGEREHGILELAPVMSELEQAWLKDGKEELVWNLREIAGQLQSDHQYVLSCRILAAERNGQKEALEEIYRSLFGHCEAIYRTDAGIWEIAERNGILLEKYFLQCDFNRWRSGTEEWIGTAPEAAVKIWKERVRGWQTTEDIRYEYFYMRCSEALLYRMSEKQPSLEELEGCFRRHEERVLCYYRKLYREEVFEGIPEALPLEAQLALRLCEVWRCRENGDERGALECLRRCVGFYSVLENAVGAYAKLYKDMLEKHNKRVEAESAELIQLAFSLKSIARKHMEQGAYQEARSILEQVDQCMQGDSEAREMLRQIEEKQK